MKAINRNGRQTTNGKTREVSPKEGLALLDRQAQRYLGMSAREFIDRWERGMIDDPDRPEVVRVAMLLPFGR